jgi:hypothetical protein
LEASCRHFPATFATSLSSFCTCQAKGRREEIGQVRRSTNIQTAGSSEGNALDEREKCSQAGRGTPWWRATTQARESQRAFHVHLQESRKNDLLHVGQRTSTERSCRPNRRSGFWESEHRETTDSSWLPATLSAFPFSTKQCSKPRSARWVRRADKPVSVAGVYRRVRKVTWRLSRLRWLKLR